MGSRSAGDQPRHVHAVRAFPQRWQSVGVCRTDTILFPGLRQRPFQAAGGLHLSTDAGRAAAGGGVNGTEYGFEPKTWESEFGRRLALATAFAVLKMAKIPGLAAGGGCSR